MKKFRIIIVIGRKTILQQLYSLNEVQQAAILKEAIKESASIEGSDILKGYLEDIMRKELGTRNYNRQEDILEKMTIMNYAETYPNAVIAAYFTQKVYQSSIYQGFADYSIGDISFLPKDFPSSRDLPFVEEIDQMEKLNWKVKFVQ